MKLAVTLVPLKIWKLANELVLDFQKFITEDGRIIISWSGNETCRRVEIMGFTLNDGMPVLSRDHVFSVVNSTSFTIPSDQLTNSEGIPVDFTLASDCEGRRNYLYRFSSK